MPPFATRLTVVMPAYNEQACIEAAVDDVRRHVLDVVQESSLLVVNDGSTDSTGELLDDFARRDDRVQVAHRENGGHGPALITGLNQSRSTYVLLVDSDLQIPLSEFDTLWKELTELDRDAVLGVRRQRDDPRIRLVLSRFIRFCLRILFGVELRDANCPFKLLRRSVWDQARHLIPEDTLAPSLFLAIFAKTRGYDVSEREVAHLRRAAGEVSIKRWSLLRFCARAFRQLLAFRRRLLTA